MTDETYEIGDVVQLKSGGEAMTIEELDEEYASCVWFEGKHVQRATFVTKTLKKYVRPSSSVTLTRG